MSQTSMPISGEVKLRVRNIAAKSFWCLLLGALMGTAVNAAEARSKMASKTAELLNTTNLFTVHFRFAPEQWDGMVPAEPAGGMFGGPGRPGRPDRAGGPGGGFGPGMFLTPAFFQKGDADHDKKLSREEFRKLADEWFTAWDKKESGTLKEEELRDGLNGVIIGGGRGPGINLQGAEGRRNGLASAAGVEFKYVKADVQIGDRQLPDVAVRYKGNGTWMGSRFDKKRSMKVEFNEFVKGQKFAGLTKLNFHNCVTDASFMNEVLSHRLYRDAGVPAPHTAFARVHVDVPGKHKDEYFGVYSVVENVDTSFAEEYFGTKKGAIFKPVTREPFEYLGDDWAKYNQTYDPKTDLSADQKKRVIEFCKLVTNATDADFTAKLGDYLDLDNFSRYMAVTVWLATLDSILGIGQNYYVYLHPKTGKLNFIPWDLDHSFGQFFLVGTQEQRERLSVSKPWQGENRFLERVFKTEAFQKLYRARLEEFSKTIFQPDRFVKQVDEVAAAIRPAVKDESETKLARFDKVVAGESVPPAGFGPPPGDRGPGGGAPGGPGGPGFPGGFMQPAKPIKGFVTVRAESVKAQLSGKEKGETLETAFGPGRPGGRGGFGPGNFLAPAFVGQLDTDKNGELSRKEFVSGFQDWFKNWDKEKKGFLTEDHLRAGLNETFQPPNAPGGPGGPVILPLGARPGGNPQ